MIRNISFIICALIGILKFLLQRHNEIILIDYTTVNNHYNNANKNQI